MTRMWWTGFALLLAAFDAAAVQCTALKDLKASGFEITAATSIKPSPVWDSPAVNGRSTRVTVPFCRVEGLIEGRIGFELWLPGAAAWNGRLLGAGVGGDAGVYNYADMARALPAGYATVTNDSGHKASEPRWMMRREAVEDYTHRSQHLMNRTARELLAAHYGRAPHHAYFIGCSGGGRQALKEMQRYPEDYDGVIAGAGAPTMPIMSARHLWQALYQQRHPDGAMSDADWALVAEGALKACDASDGVTDAVVENPARCAFDVRTLQCATGQGTRCLSAEQVRTVQQFQAPLRDEDGKVLDRGLVPGVGTRPGPPSPLLLPLFAEGAHRDPDWRAEQFHMRDDLALIERTMPEMAADDTDIRAFARRGGRAILYQGWLDPSVVAGQSIDYHERVAADIGPEAADRATRLYMVPGMLHCRGGNGVDQFGGAGSRLPIGNAREDLLAALVEWVEQGKAPGAITAVREEQGRITRRRILCPYPAEAEFLGGDANDPTRYRCSVVKR